MPIDPGFGEATFHHTATGAAGDLACVVAFDATGFTSVTAGEVTALWQQHMLANMNSLITFAGATVRFGQDGADDLVFDMSPQAGQPATGGEPGAMAPLQVCVLVRKITAVGGRRNRGRIFTPGGVESQIADNSRLLPGFLTEWQTAADAYAQAMALGPGQLAILHPARPSYFRRDGTQVPALPAAAPTLVTALQVEALVATQRRRIR